METPVAVRNLPLKTLVRYHPKTPASQRIAWDNADHRFSRKHLFLSSVERESRSVHVRAQNELNDERRSFELVRIQHGTRNCQLYNII